MKVQIVSIVLIMTLIVPISAQKMKTSADSLSYAMGIMFGENVKLGGFKDINPQIFAEVMQKVLKGEQVALTQEQASVIINNQYQKMQEQMSEKNKQAGKTFLEANKNKPGVVVLPSGLQYKVITTGTGPKPVANDVVTVHYHGTLIDGTVFDSSVQRGEPIELAVDRVIPGWTEALQLMPTGSKWILYIPAELAYGSASTGPIEANSTLIFEVELISINK